MLNQRRRIMKVHSSTVAYQALAGWGFRRPNVIQPSRRIIPMPRPRRIEGYAIVSEDGMLANAAGIMPDSLKFDADRRFFERGLDGVDVVVHGRHSNEMQPHSPRRKRLILTRRIAALEADPSNAKALCWNPAGASFEAALAAIGEPNAIVGIIGGTDVFG